MTVKSKSFKMDELGAKVGDQIQKGDLVFINKDTQAKFFIIVEV